MPIVPVDFFFLHIPKTAGSSLKELIRSRVPHGTLYSEFDVDQWIRHPEQLPTAPYGALCGHLPGDVSPWIGAGIPEFTLLREPLARAVSHYKHIRDISWHPHHQRVRELGSFGACLRDAWVSRYFGNYQARYLAFDGAPYPRGAFWRWQRDDAALEALAKARLDRMDVVGTVERFEDSVKLLATVFGWGAVDPHIWTNRGKPDTAVQGLPAEDREQLIAMNQVDLAVYADAIARLDAQQRTVTAMPSAHPGEWAALQQRSIDRLSRVAEAQHRLLQENADRLNSFGARMGLRVQRLANAAFPEGTGVRRWLRAALRPVRRLLR